MNKYEMLYILDAQVTDEVKETIISKFETIVTSNGGAVEKVDKWGVKKLAYEINYKTEGYYVLMTFEADAKIVDEIQRIAGINESVMRRVITRV